MGREAEYYNGIGVSMLNVIRDLQPDAMFVITNTSLNIILIKNNEVYFLGYWNGTPAVIVPYQEWLRDLKERRQLTWSSLIWKKSYKKQ